MAEQDAEKIPTRSVTFRMPVPLHAELAEIARRRGCDLSALLVTSLSTDIHRLRAQQVRLDLEAAVASARAAGASEELVSLLGALKASTSASPSGEREIDLWGDREWEGIEGIAERVAWHLEAILNLRGRLTEGGIQKD
jgi:post-segregation antitoxin (ccd killing protein)